MHAAGTLRDLTCITLCIAICMTLCITLQYASLYAYCDLCMLPGPCGTLRNTLCMLPGPCGTQRDPGRGEEQEQEQDFPVPPALATAESRLRAHTASRRDHVTDTEHDFPVGGDGQAGLTTPKPPTCKTSLRLIGRCRRM